MQDSTAVTQYVGQVNEVLDAIATRFGATGAHLWEVLVRQAVVEAYISIAAFVTLLILTGTAWFIAETAEDYNISELAALIAISLTVVTVVTLINTLIQAPGLLNPEYYALQDILEALP